MALNNLLTKQASQILAYKGLAAESIRNNEGHAAKLANTDLSALMQRAGLAAFEYMQALWPNAKRVLVVAGNGNNAGDAYVLACHAKQASFFVKVMCEDPSRLLSSDAGVWQAKWFELEGQTECFDSIAAESFDLVVDGLLGTGLKGKVTPNFLQMIRHINQADLPVLSLDVPSGLESDTGIGLPESVHSAATISFIAPKLGLLTGVGKHYCGQLKIASLGVDQTIHSLVGPRAQLVDWNTLLSLPARPIHANKGTFGKLVCIGGGKGMAGAIRLSAESALRSGAGMVRVICDASSVLHVASGRPELMVDEGNLLAALDWCSVVVLGPGLGKSDWAKQTFKSVIEYLVHKPKALVLDADGLNLLGDDFASYAELLSQLPSLVLTPHPGEAARLLNTSIRAVEADRYASCLQISQKYQAACILKGAGSIICDPDEPLAWVCNGGNPGMAVAGMGDLLSGICGAMLAQGLDPAEAAVYSVCAHAEAGDRVAKETGQRGILATDLLLTIQTIINE